MSTHQTPCHCLIIPVDEAGYVTCDCGRVWNTADNLEVLDTTEEEVVEKKRGRPKKVSDVEESSNSS